MDELQQGSPGLIIPGSDENEEESSTDSVTSPAKVLRIGSMIKALLDEVRTSSIDENSRMRLAEIYESSIKELAQVLSPDLAEELRSFSLPFREGEVPSESELRIVQAQLVGWLEGLFHGIQATLFAQHMATQSQLQDLRGRGLPPGSEPMPGNYL
ncbi:MAG: bacterial proteasome activator family protein [Ferrimicrobium sp.]